MSGDGIQPQDVLGQRHISGENKVQNKAFPAIAM